MELIKFLVIAIFFLSADGQESSDFVFESNFSRLVHSKYYLDKSLLLKDLLGEDQHNFLHFMGLPSQFAKTVNVQMMKHFFEIPLDDKFIEINDKFKTPNFELFRFSKFYEQAPIVFEAHFGQHPVIHIDFKPLTNVSNYGQMVQKISTVIRNTYLQHEHVLDHPDVFRESVERMQFVQYCDKKHSKKLDVIDIEESFIFLAEILFRRFGRQTVVLIDNHFCFLEGMISKHSTDVDLVFDLFRRVMKPINIIPHDYIFRCFSTGLMTFTHHGKVTFLFTEFNFFQPHDFLQYFGMTKQELKETLEKFTQDKETFKKYYIHIYYFYKYRLTEEQPLFKISSVMEYLDRRKRGVYLNLNHHVPKIVPCLPALITSTDLRKEMILAIHGEGVRLEDFTEKFDTEDVIGLKSILDYKHVLDPGKPRRLIFIFMTKLGYFIFEDSRSFLAENYVLLVPNSIIKSELRYILEESVKQQYRIKNYFIYKLTNAIRNTTESNYALQEGKIVQKFKQLLKVSEFHPMGVHLQSEIYSLLSRKFDMIAAYENVTGSEQHLAYQLKCGDYYNYVLMRTRLLDLRFKNNGIVFYIDSATFRDETEEHKRACVRRVTERLIKRRRSKATKCVFIGLCYGVLNKTVGVGVAFFNKAHKKMNNKQILDCINIF